MTVPRVPRRERRRIRRAVVGGPGSVTSAGLPPLPSASPPARRRGRWLLLGALLLVALVVGTVAVGPGQVFCGGIPLGGDQITSAQPARSAGWAGPPKDTYTDEQIDEIAKNNSYFYIPKFAEKFDIAKQFQDVKRLKAAAEKYGTDLKVFMYINAQYWLNANSTTWKPYAADFSRSYYLEGADGDPVPYYGQTGSAGTGKDPVGYLIDLSKPAVRQFLVDIGKDWLERAPLDGVVFDSADPLRGDEMVRRTNGDGNSTANDLLCGANARTDADGDCTRVAAWNDGLSDLLQSMTDALKPLGAETVYNGVAPSPLRENRNIANLAHADGASNEGFCFQPSVRNPTKVVFNSVTDDARLMQQAAKEGKKLFQITNYLSDVRKSYGSYCLGSFLMGWQPGSSYFIWHQDYATVEKSLPLLPDQDLDLGQPSSVGFQQQGDLLSRSFERGFVAVNTGDAPAQFTAPRSGSQFADGKVVGRIGEGATMTLPARSSAFFLDVTTVPKVGTALGACSG